MRAIGFAVVLAALAPLRAQGATVEDLFAHDWQARNRAAAALCAAATVDEKALIEAMGREVTRDPYDPGPQLSGGHGLYDPVGRIYDEQLRLLPWRPGPFAAQVPLTLRDLVVPFDPQVLAALVLHIRGVQSQAVGDALLRLASHQTRHDLATCSAVHAFALGANGEVARTQGLRAMASAAHFASAAHEGGTTAAREVIAALREGSGAIRIELLRHLDSGWVAQSEDLGTEVLQLVHDDATGVASAAVGLVRAARLYERRSFLPLLVDPRTSERATLALLGKSNLPSSLTNPLTKLLLDDEATNDARVRAAFVLGAMGPALERDAPELAEKAFGACFTMCAKNARGRAQLLTSLAALGAYKQSMTSDCEARLVRLTNASFELHADSRFVALGALLDAGRVDAMPFASLEAYWKQYSSQVRGGRLIPALVRRGVEAAPLLRSVPEHRSFTLIPRDDLVALAPTFREWLGEKDESVRRIALRGLARLGGQAGIEEESVLQLCRDDGESARSEVLSDELRNWLAEVARSEASFDWLVDHWKSPRPTARAIEAIAKAPFPIEKRTAWLRSVLRFAPAELWPIQHWTADELRGLARSIHADRPHDSQPVAVLLRLGPLSAEDQALVLSALRSGSDGVVQALLDASTLPDGMRDAVEAMCGDRDDFGPEHGPSRLLWATRPR